MTHADPIRRNLHAPAARRASEAGYMLLVAIFLLALFTLSLAVAVPKITKSLQRDRDLETFRRGMQYRRAVQLYYRTFHAYPPNVDALVKTNNIRFLRKKYVDPTTGKAEWKPVLFGQNKTPTAMGFFGQPLAGGATSIAGIGPGGGNGLAGASPIGSSSGGLFDSSSSSSSTTTSSSSTSSSTDNSGGTGSTTGTTDSSGGSSSTSGSSSAFGSTSSSGLSGQTFGGGGIIGFSPGSAKQSILVYKKKNHYNEWEFTYDPISEMQTMTGGNAGMMSQPGTAPPAGAGTNTNLNNPGGFSLSPTPTPTAPATPSQ
jgi:type II secretory pathway pseudopilin PulG